MPKYKVLSDKLAKQIEEEQKNGTFIRVGFENSNIQRRSVVTTDKASIWRPPFVHDIDKIMHCPYYNRYTDKTQVFSLIKNDDITRRSLHVQLVSRISRTIGRALNLNLDLIEAIALGHDIGHPPFAHTGEWYLD
ncbi:MAG: HD domain-containing protein, partial [Ruminococcaceae bacterium]|nr:HD domain-containing protein [Oscillospiraceae bacterium]